MKFTDGQWLLQPGAAVHHAAEAYDVTASLGRGLCSRSRFRPHFLM